MPTTQPCPKCSAQVPAGSRFCQVCGSSAAEGDRKTGKSGGGSQTKLFLAGAVAIILVMAAVLVGLGSGSGQSRSGSVAEIAGAGPIPDWLKNADPAIIADYAWAAQHHEELQYIPCYCGCGSVGHTSNATCYYRWDKNGKALGYDAHALG